MLDLNLDLSILRLSRSPGVLPDYGHCSVMTKGWSSLPWLLSFLFFSSVFGLKRPFQTITSCLITSVFQKTRRCHLYGSPHRRQSLHTHIVFSGYGPSTFDINIDRHQATSHWRLSSLTGKFERKLLINRLQNQHQHHHGRVHESSWWGRQARESCQRGKARPMETHSSVLDKHALFRKLWYSGRASFPRTQTKSASSIFYWSRLTRAVARSRGADETEAQSGEPPGWNSKNCTAGRRKHSRGRGGPATTIYRILYAPSRIIRFMWPRMTNLEFGRHPELAPRKPSSSWLPVPEPTFSYKSSRNEVNLQMGRLLGMVWLQNIKIPPANVNVY